MACLCPTTGDVAVEIYCCEALPAWEEKRYMASREASERALEANPDHAPSQLLYGFTLLRTDGQAQGIELLEEVRDHRDVGRLARRAIRTHRNRWNRRQLSATVGGEAGLGGGALFRFEVPLDDQWSFRIDTTSVNHWETNFMGWNLGASGGYNVTNGPWRIQATAGLYDAQLTEPVFTHSPGLRGGVNVDWRALQVLAFGSELGGAIHLYRESTLRLPYWQLYITVFAPGMRDSWDPTRTWAEP